MSMALTWRARLVLAASLTLGLLAWEILLLWLITGQLGTSAAALGRQLAWDAATFLPLSVAAWSCARWGSRGLGVLEAAARVSLAFSALLLPVAGARALLQQQIAQPAPAEARPGASISALKGAEFDNARFLCSVASTDARGDGAPGDAPLDVALAGMRDVLPLPAALFPLTLFVLGYRTRYRSGLFREAKAPYAWLALLGGLVALCTWRSDSLQTSPDLSLAALQAAGGCAPDAPVRAYALAAISVDIPLNAYGDHVPGGFMYALEEDLPAVRAQEQRSGPTRVSPGLRQDPIQPLVLRANLGECLVLRFTNRLAAEPAALRIEGLGFTRVEDPSPGSFIPRASLPAGQHLTYVLPLPSARSAEGAYLLHDPEDSGGREERGLFGALVLEPAGSVYRSPATGEPSRGTGWEAIIDVPAETGRDFREVVLLPHGMGAPETADVRMASGQLLPVLDEMAGPYRPGSLGFNYRSEPVFDRDEYQGGDPEESRPPVRHPFATPMPWLYLDEPVRLRLLQAGSPEFHVYSLRNMRGQRGSRASPDSIYGVRQLLSPGRGVTLHLEPGQDGFPRLGDTPFSCRMPNHPDSGMRGVWRVLASHIPGLAPLPDRQEP